MFRTRRQSMRCSVNLQVHVIVEIVNWNSDIHWARNNFSICVSTHICTSTIALQLWVNNEGMSNYTVWWYKPETSTFVLPSTIRRGERIFHACSYSSSWRSMTWSMCFVTSIGGNNGMQSNVNCSVFRLRSAIARQWLQSRVLVFGKAMLVRRL